MRRHAFAPRLSPPAGRRSGLTETTNMPQGIFVAPNQSACLRKKAGISISSMPFEVSASTLDAAVRP